MIFKLIENVIHTCVPFEKHFEFKQNISPDDARIPRSLEKVYLRKRSLKLLCL